MPFLEGFRRTMSIFRRMAVGSPTSAIRRCAMAQSTDGSERLQLTFSPSRAAMATGLPMVGGSRFRRLYLVSRGRFH